MHARQVSLVALALFASAFGKVWHVQWTQAGTDPAHVVISVGDSVQWDNNDVGGHEPVNNDPAHPGHPFVTSTEPSPLDIGSPTLPGAIAAHEHSSPVAFPHIGFFPWADQLNKRMNTFWGDITVRACGAVCEDPHFYGLDGVHYDFQGRPGETFSLISDPATEVNSKFVRSVHGTTTIGDTCVRTCGDHSVVLSPANRTVYVDGLEVSIAKSYSSPKLIVQHITSEYVYVHIAGRWNLRFNFVDDDLGAHLNLDYAEPLYTYAGHTHGVLGHTLSMKPVPKERCNIETEGSCEVEGSFKNYRINGDLCSSEWMYTQFNAQC